MNNIYKFIFNNILINTVRMYNIIIFVICIFYSRVAFVQDTQAIPEDDVEHNVADR